VIGYDGASRSCKQTPQGTYDSLGECVQLAKCYQNYIAATAAPTAALTAALPTYCNETLKPNTECMIMEGPAMGVKGLVDNISVTNTGEKVYIKFDSPYTKMVTASGEAKYYQGPISDYKPCNWSTYTPQTQQGAYVIRVGSGSECSAPLCWTTANAQKGQCMGGWQLNGGSCIDPAGSNKCSPYNLSGMATYNDDLLNNWVNACGVSNPSGCQ
jgi:hypothetical protein